MINIKKELENYKFTNEASKLEVDGKDELEALIRILSKSYEKIGKEQYKALGNIDEIFDMLEENSEEVKDKQNIINELKQREGLKNEEMSKLINSIISILDMIDYIDSFVLKSSMENLKEQFKLVYDQLTEKLAQASITVLGIEGGNIDMNIHKAIAAEFHENKAEGLILQVVKKGYMYKGNLIRKAEVVINKKAIKMPN